jgi:hypothetical protein
VSPGSPRAASRLGRAGLALLLLLFASGTARGDFRTAYKNGLDAFEKGDWAETARQMRLAIAERPDATGALTSTLLRRYTPHYYLGVALAEMGDCRGAVTTLDAAEQQGKLGRDEERELVRRRDECRGRIARTEEALVGAQREVDSAAAAAFEVARLEATPVLRPVWSDGSPSFADRQRPATGKLAAARTALARGTSELDPERVAEAARLAQEARGELERLAREATARRDELQVAVERELSEMNQAATAARRDLDFVTRSLAPLPSDLGRRAKALQDALAATAAANIGSPLSELQRLQDALRRAVRELRAAVRPPPEELQEAARAYLSGDYPAAAALLEQSEFAEPRAAAHACLLHAASLFGLARMHEDEPTLQRARDELYRCQALPVHVRPFDGAFPPAFVALHAEVAAQAAPGSP